MGGNRGLQSGEEQNVNPLKEAMTYSVLFRGQSQRIPGQNNNVNNNNRKNNFNDSNKCLLCSKNNAVVWVCVSCD